MRARYGDTERDCDSPTTCRSSASVLFICLCCVYMSLSSVVVCLLYVLLVLFVAPRRHRSRGSCTRRNRGCGPRSAGPTARGATPSCEVSDVLRVFWAHSLFCFMLCRHPLHPALQSYGPSPLPFARAECIFVGPSDPRLHARAVLQVPEDNKTK